MRIERLSDTSADLVSEPYYRLFLPFLQNRLGAQITRRDIHFSGDYLIEFSWEGHHFQLETVFLSPILSSHDCPKELFHRLLARLEEY